MATIGEIRVVVHLDEAEMSLLREVNERLKRIERKEDSIMAKAQTLDDILARIQAQGTVEDGIKVLVDSLVAQKNDPAKLAAIVSALDGNDAKLSAAVLDGTPVAPTSNLTVIPASVSIANGSSQSLSVDDANGKDITSTVGCVSDDPTIASVSGAVVTGNKVGSTSITVTDPASGESAKVPVTVS